MPTIPPQIDPEAARPEAGTSQRDETTSWSGDTPETRGQAPGDEADAKSGPVRFRTNRFGELEEHELIHLLDSIEDERARGRFRESIYISLFVWLAIAWVVFYGPRYLWHSPQLVSPVEMMKRQEMVQLNAPVLPHARAAAPRAVDKATLAKVKAMDRKPTPAAPAAAKEPTPTPVPAATQPTPSNEKPNVPIPNAPTPVPVPTRTPPPVVAEAPRPQPSARPNFGQPGTASDTMRDLANNVARDHGGGGGPVAVHGGSGGAALGSGVEVLSPNPDNVNLNPYLQRLLQQIYEQWLPLIPEEARPPLNKQGVTQIRFSIGPDGNVVAMHLDGSTHDDALNRAAWGSVNGQQFAPLPKQFHQPFLELRIHYLVNRTTE